MAAVEITTVNTEKNPDLTSSPDLETDIQNHVEIAKEYLLLRNFKKCHLECLKGIGLARRFPEIVRVQERTEQLCVLCIQALAEMNKWQEVLPLVQDVYIDIEACPHSVIKLCILLHARVEEYAQCHAITSIWLRCKENSVRTGYIEVASLYIEHVMVPQEQVLLVPQFLDSCTVLETNVKTELAEKFIKFLKEKHDNQISVKSDTNVEEDSEDRLSPGEDRLSPGEDTDDHDIFVAVFSHLKAMASLLVSKLSYPSLDLLLKIAAAAVSLLLLMKLTLKGDYVNSLGNVTSIWQGLLRTLSSAFTPYRRGR